MSVTITLANARLETFGQVLDCIDQTLQHLANMHAVRKGPLQISDTTIALEHDKWVIASPAKQRSSKPGEFVTSDPAHLSSDPSTKIPGSPFEPYKADIYALGTVFKARLLPPVNNTWTSVPLLKAPRDWLESLFAQMAMVDVSKRFTTDHVRSQVHWIKSQCGRDIRDIKLKLPQ